MFRLRWTSVWKNILNLKRQSNGTTTMVNQIGNVFAKGLLSYTVVVDSMQYFETFVITKFILPSSRKCNGDNKQAMIKV